MSHDCVLFLLFSLAQEGTSVDGTPPVLREASPTPHVLREADPILHVPREAGPTPHVPREAGPTCISKKAIAVLVRRRHCHCENAFHCCAEV